MGALLRRLLDAIRLPSWRRAPSCAMLCKRVALLARFQPPDVHRPLGRAGQRSESHWMLDRDLTIVRFRDVRGDLIQVIRGEVEDGRPLLAFVDQSHAYQGLLGLSDLYMASDCDGAGLLRQIKQRLQGGAPVSAAPSAASKDHRSSSNG